MVTPRFRSDEAPLDAFYEDLSAAHLQPLWELHGLLTPTPRVRAVPYRWRAEELAKLGRRAGDLVPIGRGGDRRVLAMSNPGLDGAPFVSGTLWAAVQYLQPHESAPAHRHTPAALRFILDGRGVYTRVDGDPLAMSRGDLVLTPSWTFHEHHNPGDVPMMWLDVLDLPLVAALDAVFFEPGPAEQARQATAPRSSSEAWFAGGSGLIPVAGPDLPAHRSPLLAYRWAETERALEGQLSVCDAGHARLRYSDPVRGGDVMPTMRCEMERLRPGTTTATVRRTGGQVTCVLNGTGRIEVGSGESAQAFDVEAGDIVAIPSWAPRKVRAETQLDLFTTSDAPVLEALGLFRAETMGSSASADPSPITVP